MRRRVKICQEDFQTADTYWLNPRPWTIAPPISTQLKLDEPNEDNKLVHNPNSNLQSCLAPNLKRNEDEYILWIC